MYHLQHDATLADLSDQERAILEYAEKLNFFPGKITEADLEKLRNTGLDDRGILDVVLVVCLYNFMNRLAEGLGVEPERAYLKSKERAEKRVEEALKVPQTG